jgi:hypothetical protein
MILSVPKMTHKSPQSTIEKLKNGSFSYCVVTAPKAAPLLLTGRYSHDVTSCHEGNINTKGQREQMINV